MAALDTAQIETLPPLSTLQGDLVVASYNLLAPCFVRPVDTRTGTVQEFAAFRWCDDAVLAVSYTHLTLPTICSV